MVQILVEGALLICNKGAKPCKLKITSQQFFKVDDKLIATEFDKIPMVNIPDFGVCAVTQVNCVPAIISWEKAAKKDTVNNVKILTDKSFCQCGVGGKIEVKLNGTTEKYEVS